MTINEALIAVLKKSFNDCWSRETSSDPEHWTPENPSWGHCAVAELVAQAVLGGDLLRYDLSGTPFAAMGSHYKLRLHDGTILDFTDAQFGGHSIAWGEPKVRTRKELLDPAKNPRNQGTLDRYNLFRGRVKAWLDSFREEARK